MKKESYIRILPDVIDNDSLEWFAEDYCAAIMKPRDPFQFKFLGVNMRSLQYGLKMATATGLPAAVAILICRRQLFNQILRTD